MYEDFAFETSILNRQVFHLALRQAQVFMNSIDRLMNTAITIPDFSSITKLNLELPRHILNNALELGSLVIVDSTGLKTYGKDEWCQEKHGNAARRTWRNQHLAIDENYQILACELTNPEVGDPTAVTGLLAQTEAPFDTFMGDGETVPNAVLARQFDAKVVV